MTRNRNVPARRWEVSSPFSPRVPPPAAGSKRGGKKSKEDEQSAIEEELAVGASEEYEIEQMREEAERDMVEVDAAPRPHWPPCICCVCVCWGWGGRCHSDHPPSDAIEHG